eukprot:ANDGO_03976.mRNA.1 hypothetical protein
MATLGAKDIVLQVLVSVSLFMFLVLLVFGTVKYVYIRRLRRRKGASTFSEIVRIPSTARDSMTDDVDMQVLIDCFDASQPLSTVNSLVCFFAFLPVPDCNVTFDRIHVIWAKISYVVWLVFYVYSIYLLYMLDDGLDESESSNGAVLTSSSRLFLFVASAITATFLLIVVFSIFNICRKGYYHAIIVRLPESQLVDQSQFSGQLVSTLQWTRRVLRFFAFALIIAQITSVSNSVSNSGASDSAQSVVVFIVLQGILRTVVTLLLFTNTAFLMMVGMYIYTEAKVVDIELQRVCLLLQGIIDNAQLSKDAQSVSLEVNPLFRHKHKHVYRPSETKLSDVLQGFSLNVAFHSLSQIIAKVRFASKHLSLPLFSIIPTMFLSFVTIILSYLINPVTTAASLSNFIYVIFVQIGPFMLVFWIYTLVTIATTDCKSTAIRTMTMYGLIAAEGQQRPEVVIEALSHLPPEFNVGGVALTSDAFAKLFTLLSTLIGAVIAFSGR